MPKPNRNGIPKMVTLFPVHVDMIEKIINEKGMASMSEVVRSAIISFYHGFYPTYKAETAAGKLKEKKLSEIEEYESITDEDFAKQTLSGLVLPNDKSELMVLLHWVGNTLKPVPLAGIKKWAEVNEPAVNFHLSKLKSLPVTEMLSDYMKQNLKNSYGIVVPE